MTLLEKINELNKLNGNSLSITRFINGWEINCHQDNLPLSIENKYPFIKNQNFEDLISEALEYSRKMKL